MAVNPSTTKGSKTNRENLFLSPINSLIGDGATFRGDLSLKGSLRIDGEFFGKLCSQAKIIVGENGHVKTNVEAKLVIISGRVDGNVYATESVHLIASGKVYGDIISPNLFIEEGAVFEGRARISRNTAFNPSHLAHS